MYPQLSLFREFLVALRARMRLGAVGSMGLFEMFIQSTLAFEDLLAVRSSTFYNLLNLQLVRCSDVALQVGTVRIGFVTIWAGMLFLKKKRVLCFRASIAVVF